MTRGNPHKNYLFRQVVVHCCLEISKGKYEALFPSSWLNFQDRVTLETTVRMEYLCTINILSFSQDITKASQCRRKLIYSIAQLNHFLHSRMLPVVTAWEDILSVHNPLSKLATWPCLRGRWVMYNFHIWPNVRM